MQRFLSFLAFVIGSVLGGSAPPLGSWNIDRDLVTVSGFSSGAGFSTQFHVAFSSSVHGMGSWAGAPYTCKAEFDFDCIDFPEKRVDVQVLVNNSYELEADGRIDPVLNMASDKIYVYHGTEDKNVRPGSANNMVEYYQTFLDNPIEDMLLKNDLASTHAVVSDHAGTECGRTNFDTYIENCDYESPFYMLNHMMGDVILRGVEPGTYTGELVTFDQDEFFDNDDAMSYSMDDTGYVYVPQQCEDQANTCLLHFYFHGCELYADRIGTDFILESGFLELADANNIVVLFPQMTSSELTDNPKGCWDWAGFTNPPGSDPLFYATREAPTMSAVYRMIQRALGQI